MATLAEITIAIKERLGTIDKLSSYAIEPASPKYPAVWPFLRSPAAEYDQTFDGAMTWFFSLTLALSSSDTGHAQTNLMPYLAPSGPKSIKAAIDALPNLGLAGVYASVRRVESIGTLSIAGGQAVGAVLVLEVMS